MERDEREKLPEPLELLKAVADILRPLKDSTVTLSSSSCPTLHLVIPHFLKVKKAISRPLPVELQDLQEYEALESFKVHLISTRNKCV